MGHDEDSPSWIVWLAQDGELVKSAHVILQDESRLLDLVGEMQDITLKVRGWINGGGEASG